MDRLVFVSIELDGFTVLVGRLWTRSKGGRESASFEYAPAWLSDPRRFSLEPALQLGAGTFHTPAGKKLFGAIGDSAPDRWGRRLMLRAERAKSIEEKRKPRTLLEIDYLLGVDDQAREGALRFSLSEGGPYLQEMRETRIPPLVELPKLLAATTHFEQEHDTDEDLRLLLAPGSSLGGARPKASVIDQNGQLAIAKFPKQSDEWDEVRWEALALILARKAKIDIPEWRLETIETKPTMLVRRFDREPNQRIPFLSAMSMLGASDNEDHSYIEIADAIRSAGAAPKRDLAELWRRLVFNILISNTDDHLRNHAFLFQGTEGWRLSPAYDLNPTPTDVRPRILSTMITEQDGTASLELAMEVLPAFGLSPEMGRAIAKEVGMGVRSWRKAAKSIGLRDAEIERFADSFEHVDLELALRG